MQTLSQDTQREKMRQIAQHLHKTFTKHPEETGETYVAHLWFTVSMSIRFVIVSLILMIHGLMPFFFTRTASAHIEKIYRIMKERASKTGHNSDMYDI